MPIDIAVQWSGLNTELIWDLFTAADIYGPTEKNPHWLIITTPDGEQRANASDWIARTEHGLRVLHDDDPDLIAWLDSKSRDWHHMYALMYGYFWAPCPLCGNYFGGHEWRRRNGLSSVIADPDYPKGSGRGAGICPTCTKAGYGDRGTLLDDAESGAGQ